MCCFIIVLNPCHPFNVIQCSVLWICINFNQLCVHIPQCLHLNEMKSWSSPGHYLNQCWISLIGHLWTKFSELLIAILIIVVQKCIWKCRLWNNGHFVSAPMCSRQLCPCTFRKNSNTLVPTQYHIVVNHVVFYVINSHHKYTLIKIHSHKRHAFPASSCWYLSLVFISSITQDNSWPQCIITTQVLQDRCTGLIWPSISVVTASVICQLKWQSLTYYSKVI